MRDVRKVFIGIAAFAMACLPWGSDHAWSYQGTPVKDGGTVKGKISLVGGKPRPKAFNLVTFPDPKYCGRISTGTGWRLLEDFVIGPDNGLKDVVVMLEDVESGKSWEFAPPRVEAIDCMFAPFVTVVKNHEEVVVVNMDPVMHDIQAYQTSDMGARVLFNNPLPMNPYHDVDKPRQTHEHRPGKPIRETIHLDPGRNIFVMQCGFHAYMESWGLVVDNPYYAVTPKEGTFSLTDVPPGDYTLVAWHPGMKERLEKRITVAPNTTVSMDFEFHAPKGRRSAHEMVENPHFGMEMLGEEVEIVPSVKLQKP